MIRRKYDEENRLWLKKIYGEKTTILKSIYKKQNTRWGNYKIKDYMIKKLNYDKIIWQKN